MAIKIQTTKDVKIKGVKIVIYGDSGVGKTFLASQLDNVVVLSTENKMLTLSKFDIPYYQIKNFEDMQEAFDAVKKSNYKNIFIDSITEVAETLLLFLKNKANENKGKKTDPRPAYMDLADAIGALIRNFRDIDGKNIIMICKEKPIYEEGSEDIIGYKPFMPGRVLPHGIPYLVDEVFSYQINRKGERFIQTVSDYKRTCKDSSGVLEDKIYNPNLKDIIDLILGNEKPPTSRLPTKTEK